MKLKDLFRTVSEGHVEPNMLMAVRRVIKQGHVTDNVQWLALARFSEMLRSGELLFDNPNFFPSAGSVSKTTIDALKAMPPDELLKTAQDLLNLLELKDANKLKGLNKPDMPIIAWYELVGQNAAQLD